MSRSSNQKRKRKTRRATGVPCEPMRTETIGWWGADDVVFHPPGPFTREMFEEGLRLYRAKTERPGPYILTGVA